MTGVCATFLVQVFYGSVVYSMSSLAKGGIVPRLLFSAAWNLPHVNLTPKYRFYISLEIQRKQYTLMSLTFAAEMPTFPSDCVHLESRAGLVRLRLGQLGL